MKIFQSRVGRFKSGDLNHWFKSWFKSTIFLKKIKKIRNSGFLMEIERNMPKQWLFLTFQKSSAASAPLMGGLKLILGGFSGRSFRSTFFHRNSPPRCFLQHFSKGIVLPDVFLQNFSKGIVSQMFIYKWTAKIDP